MFKTLIILYALSFRVTECTPNPGRSFPHWLAPMLSPLVPPQSVAEPLSQRFQSPASGGGGHRT